MNAHSVLPLAPDRVAPARPLVRIVTVGHVDHGKSTLIGRLLAETGGLPDGKLDQLKAVSARRGMPFEWSFLLDALQAERDQGITIDTSQIRLRTPARDIVLIDAPGHAEFLRNMVTGAAQADAALLIVDAVDGMQEQTRRHSRLLQLLGVRQLVVVVNKMDRVDYDAGRFHAIEAEILAHLDGIGLATTAVIPVSARHGDGVAAHSSALAWYAGLTVLAALDRLAPAQPGTALPLRMPVQAVYKFDDRRILAGRVESGRIAVGDEIVLAPSGKSARVASIEAWPDASGEPRAARAGQSIGITFDRDLFVERGDLVSSAVDRAAVARRLTARIFWLHEAPLEVGAEVTVRIAAAQAHGTVAAIHNSVDPGALTAVADSRLAQNSIADVEIALATAVAADTYEDNPRTGRIVIGYAGRIAGGGLVRALAVPARPAPARPQDSDALAQRAADLTAALAGLAPAERLAKFRAALDGRMVFTTSFGLEDQVVLHHLCAAGLDVEVVTLDTGRLFPETYATWEETERRYGRRIRAIYPRQDALEALVAAQGINGFYHAREARLACCDVRKVEPLARALAAANGWITGLRADQSAHRRGVALVEADGARGLLKLSPLFDHTRDAVSDFARDHGVPVNPLHAQGVLSIGCAPCTRAARPGEPERAGRWWWEDDAKKECGLHLGAAG
ncbi:MAG TPA: phosphoadenylyl-sulfate reductase [Xanthobacteraceae bacterium]|nr:phosphoadenylyl-sulfate reductase [Xanthobacteraceae bacterium]